MPQLTLQQAFARALQHHQAGQLQQAEQIYRQVLALQPDHADALHLLGVLAHQVGRYDVAVELLRKALAANPNSATPLANLGNALQGQGQLDAAIAAHRQAIAVNPNYPEAHYNLGNALREKAQLDDAIAAFRQAIASKPNYTEAYNNLGNALHDKGRLDEAIAAFRQALALNPSLPEVHTNLASALTGKGQLNEAIAACRQALALKSNLPEAHYNLGNALRDNGQFEDAITAFRQALALQPGYADARNNLGNALKDEGQLDEAIAAYRQTIALQPGYAKACTNLGVALKDAGQLDEAIAAHRQALALNPDFAEAHSNLVSALHYHPSTDAQALAAELRRWNHQHAEPLRKFILPHPNDRSPDRRLRIGYVSSDFWAHASSFFLVPLLEHHDARQVEVFCYAQVLKPDVITRRLQRCAAGWRSTVGLTDEQVAAQIRADRIDLLVDLKLHTSHNRLLVFARKPAPVQVTWLGFPGSTGLATIDYRLSDPYLDPPGIDESIYSEQTIRLPETFWCYDPLEGRDIPVNALPALTHGHITFGSLNNFGKITPAVLRLWSQVLQAVPSSRLLLLAPEGRTRQETLSLFAKEGIAPQRIAFAARHPRPGYLELYHRIDLGLDSFPYNGHTTSLDSFWMGVPVVTLIGQTAVGRAGFSQLMNLDLPGLITRTPDQYIQSATALAHDLSRLADLRATLRARMQASPLMDAPRFARHIESAYRQMWRKWCTQAPALR